MRILANFGRRNNGDSYSVTFETQGDVEMDHAEKTVDELFRLAREAVQRQMEEKDLEFPPREELVIPKPKNGKPFIKDPGAPATIKQRGLIGKLAKQKGVFIDGLNSLTMAEASHKIEELMVA